MKKFTILFATLLAMSGMTFGQVLPKVLWESNDNAFNLVRENYIKTSPSGNILVVMTNDDKSQNAKAFDKNGKLLWSDKDYYNKQKAQFYVDTENPKYTLIRCDIGFPDSLLYFDENFKFLKGFDVVVPKGTYFSKAENGIFYHFLDKPLIKYDNKGKEEWSYKTDSLLFILTQKPPYIGYVIKDLNNTYPLRSFIILDKNGKKKGITDSQTYEKIYPTEDKGFWLSTSSDYQQSDFIKYDSIYFMKIVYFCPIF